MSELNKLKRSELSRLAGQSGHMLEQHSDVCQIKSGILWPFRLSLAEYNTRNVIGLKFHTTRGRHLENGPGTISVNPRCSHRKPGVT